MSSDLQKIRHSLAHILAEAVLQMRPHSQLGFGPAIDDGLYYDFILSAPLNDSDFPELEKRMRNIIKSNPSFIREDLDIPEALARLDKMGEPYKRDFAQELVQKRNEKSISFYRSGNFQDMCDGPHVKEAREIPLDGFKIRSIAGAYWRGDSSQAVMSRIYVWAFASKKELEAAVLAQEEALLRDHRKLGKELQLFSFDEEVGPGLPLWLPYGASIRDELEKFMKELEFKAGYHRVSTPHIAKGSMYEKSGHLEHYADGMFPPMLISEAGKDSAKESYYLRPMNCPHHHRIFASQPRSYRDLPIRYAEYGQIYRYEDSGALSGLMRARGCCQNDAHIYCSQEQIKDEMHAVLAMHKEAYEVLGISEYRLRLSKWDPEDPKGKSKYVDEPSLWDFSEALLREVLLESGMPFFEASGEAAFYGPKIDVQFKSVSGKEETASTIQLDFSSGKRVGLVFVGSDGHEHIPFIIHRAPLGSHERFIAFLIEKFAAAFPLWLAPVQAKIVPLAEKHQAYAHEVARELRDQYLRVEMDLSNETLQKRIRNAALLKIPYILVVGDREQENRSVAVRIRGKREPSMQSLEEFKTKITVNIKHRQIPLA